MSANTVVVAINTSIATLTADVATLTTDVAAAYSPSNPPPAAAPQAFGAAIYAGDISPHTAPNADLTAGKVTLFENTSSSPSVNQTYTDVIFASPTDGKTFRVGNLTPIGENNHTITFNDGTNDILVVAPGEFVRLVWNSGVNQWLKVQGV